MTGVSVGCSRKEGSSFSFGDDLTFGDFVATFLFPGSVSELISGVAIASATCGADSGD